MQDNWKANSRLTLDYGVRFYYMTPQWDQTLQASTFLPDEYERRQRGRGSTTPVCIGALSLLGQRPSRHGPGARSRPTPTPRNTVEGRFIGRLVPGSDRFNGAFQAGQGINDTLQSGNAFKVSPRLGVVYDLTGKGTTIVRGGCGIFYDRPQGNMVFDMIGNAPGVLQLDRPVGPLQNLTAAARRPLPDARR